ncbi:hypothetical protein JTE90_006017 [Oedothorax gibbosus]|uniref:Uncharacterized protein n=1 Tax=Oedothorax gibbosus TaxID=931172 RepID=A0AAV6TGP8_9ARAC|nr:hypothetical protein JTE90_006017 [Oedothorax gibbosus]
MDEEWTIKRDYDASIENMKLNLAQKALYKWRLFCERKKQRKAYKNSEPLSPWLPMLMHTEYVTSGATNPFVIYKKHCALSRITDSKLKEIEKKSGWEPFETSHFESLSNQSPLPPAYLHTTGIVQYFKLGLVFVSYPDDVVSYFTEWMCQKFNLPSLPDARNKELASYSYVINGGRTVVSVTAIILGMENIGDCNEFMKGISAIILCCPSSFPNIMNFNVFVEKFDVLLKEANLLSAFPLFTIILDTNQKCNVLNQLSSFLDKRIYPEGCFSTLKMNHLPVRSGYVSNSSEVAKALKWLIVNQESRPILLCATLQNYLEDSYASAFNTLFWKISLEEFKPLVMVIQLFLSQFL